MFWKKNREAVQETHIENYSLKQGVVIKECIEASFDFGVQGVVKKEFNWHAYPYKHYGGYIDQQAQSRLDSYISILIKDGYCVINDRVYFFKNLINVDLVRQDNECNFEYFDAKRTSLKDYELQEEVMGILHRDEHSLYMR
jgi:hypothetical protein